MPVNKKQLMRLVRLVAQLKENRYPNCESFAAAMREADLSENLNLACSAKTIYRDIQTLKTDFGAPIKFDSARNGYYLSHHGWTFSCPDIDENEMIAAILGARIAEHIFPSPLKQEVRDAVDNLLTANNPDFLDHTQMDSLIVIPSNRTEIEAKVFIPLFHAWQNHEICRITYQSSHRDLTERKFEPHALVFYDGVWYAKGFCHLKNDVRVLALSRMNADGNRVYSGSEDHTFCHGRIALQSGNRRKSRNPVRQLFVQPRPDSPAPPRTGNCTAAGRRLRTPYQGNVEISPRHLDDASMQQCRNNFPCLRPETHPFSRKINFGKTRFK